MARARLVKPEFFRHYDLYAAERESGLPLRVAFEGLWTVADRDGRFEWRQEVKLDVLPYDAVDFLDVLAALERYGFVRSYEVDGRRYGVIPSLGRHQQFHVREAHSKLPAPPEIGQPTPPSAPVEHRAGTGPAPDAHGCSTPEAVREAEAEAVETHMAAGAAESEADRSFAALWSDYPTRPNNSRKQARKAYDARRRAGVPHAELAEGLDRYRAYCVARGIVGAEFVLQAATFFGPNERWRETWEPPPRAGPSNGASKHDLDADATARAFRALATAG